MVNSPLSFQLPSSSRQQLQLKCIKMVSEDVCCRVCKEACYQACKLPCGDVYCHTCLNLSINFFQYGTACVHCGEKFEREKVVLDQSIIQSANMINCYGTSLDMQTRALGYKIRDYLSKIQKHYGTEENLMETNFPYYEETRKEYFEKFKPPPPPIVLHLTPLDNTANEINIDNIPESVRNSIIACQIGICIQTNLFLSLLILFRRITTMNRQRAPTRRITLRQTLSSSDDSSDDFDEYL